MISVIRRGTSQYPSIFHCVVESSVKGSTCALDKSDDGLRTCALDKSGASGVVWSVARFGTGASAWSLTNLGVGASTWSVNKFLDGRPTWSVNKSVRSEPTWSPPWPVRPRRALKCSASVKRSPVPVRSTNLWVSSRSATTAASGPGSPVTALSCARVASPSRQMKANARACSSVRCTPSLAWKIRCRSDSNFSLSRTSSNRFRLLSLVIRGGTFPNCCQLRKTSRSPQPAFSLRPILRKAVTIRGLRTSFWPGSRRSATEANASPDSRRRSGRCSAVSRHSARDPNSLGE